MQHIYIHAEAGRLVKLKTDMAWAAEGWVTGRMEMPGNECFVSDVCLGALAGVTGTRVYSHLSQCERWEVRSISRNGTLLMVPVLLTCEPKNFEIHERKRKVCRSQIHYCFASIENKIHIINKSMRLEHRLAFYQNKHQFYTRFWVALVLQNKHWERKRYLWRHKTIWALVRRDRHSFVCCRKADSATCQKDSLHFLLWREEDQVSVGPETNTMKDLLIVLDLLIFWGPTNCCATFGLYGNLMVSLLPGEFVCSMFISFVFLVHV